VRDEFTRDKVMLTFAGGAAGCGAAAWLLLGPVWAIAGVVAGPFVALIAVSGVRAYAVPDAVTMLDKGRPDRAAAQLRRDMPALRTMARAWPGQFGEDLPRRMMTLASALRAMHQDTQALRVAAEAVAICQDLAAERPGKYALGLADALDRQARFLGAVGQPAEALAAMEVATRLYRNLAAADPRYLPVLTESLDSQASWLAELNRDDDAMAAANQAAAIRQNRPASSQVPSSEARLLLSEGERLCREGRYREAARPLAQGWRRAHKRYQRDALWQAAPALRAAYRADPDHFTAEWHAETGGEPPDWLHR